MSSFDRLATVTASTLRAGAIVDGLETVPSTNIPSLSCLPLDPISGGFVGGAYAPELILGIEGLGWREILQTTVEGGLDIIEGDILVVGSTEYPIRAVADWTWPPTGEDYQVLYLENQK